MNHYIRIKINTKKSNILIKLNKIGVNIKNIEYNKDYLICDILANDLKRVKKYLVSYKIEVIRESGIYKIKHDLKKNSLFGVSIIFSIVMFLILTNIIVKVNVIHQDRELREIIYDALKEKGVTALSFKKSYDDYEKIIEEIKEAYPDKIEWLEIDVEGMVINIRVEERIINKYNKNYNYCHIVASKSGIIKSISTKEGVANVPLNSHVNKGDILISGMIKLNEEVKNNVCASGDVYAEVWYKANATVPLNYVVKEKTGKMRFNLMIKKDKEYVLLKSRVKDKEVKKKRLFKIFGYEFYLEKEYEIKVNKKKYNIDEALKEGIRLIHEKFNVKGNDNNDIINEKVLKKNVINDKLVLEMFISLKEQIGVVKYYDIEMDSGTNAKEYNGDNN